MDAPDTPELLEMPDKLAGGTTAKAVPALDVELLVTTMFPELAPDGTVAKMREELQLVVVAAVPPNVTVPNEPKLFPLPQCFVGAYRFAT